MKAILLVGLGGMIGAVSRYGLTRWIPTDRFPWAIFVANLIGCLLIGAALAWSERNEWFTDTVRLLFVTGFLGSLTTFSTFGVDTFQMLRDGHVPLAIAYTLASVALGLVAVWIGYQVPLRFHS